MSTMVRIQWDFLDGMRGPMWSICKELPEWIGSDQDLEQDVAGEKALLGWFGFSRMSGGLASKLYLEWCLNFNGPSSHGSRRQFFYNCLHRKACFIYLSKAYQGPEQMPRQFTKAQEWKKMFHGTLPGMA